jgi:hypothetical protein
MEAAATDAAQSAGESGAVAIRIAAVPAKDVAVQNRDSFFERSSPTESSFL